MKSLFLFAIVLVGLAVAQGEEKIFMPPSITMNEPDLIIKSPLNNFALECRAYGVPPAKVKWYKDDALVTNSMMTKLTPEGTLTIIMMDQFKGKYQCKGENVFGAAASNITVIDMAALGDFTDTDPNVLQPTVVNVGDPLKLPCSYSDPFSNPQPSWSWVRQDELGDSNPVQTGVTLDGRLSVDDRGTLYFQHVELSDNPDNHYHLCEAWNPIMNIKKIGSASRMKINNVVPTDAPPVLVYQNDNAKIEVIEGETINMYCIFKGRPTVNVIWEKQGQTAKPFFKYAAGKTRAIIENSKNTDQYEGDYKCTGWQKDRSQKAVGYFKVTVLEKPTFIEGPSNVNVTEGGTVTFTCRAQAEPAATIEWFVNGEPLKNLPFDARRQVSGNNFKFEKLRRGNGPQDSDLQVVTCMARNQRPDGTEVGRSYRNGYINVVLPMKYVTPPENHTIADSTHNVIMDCEISSDPSKTPSVSWHREQAPIHLKKDRYEIAPNNSLIIFTRNFDNLDDVKGEYMCVGQTRAPAQQIQAKAWVDVKEGVVPLAPIASASINLWWIGLILVLLILLLIFLLICCLIKRNKGESYPVDEVERKMGNDPEKDLLDQGFHDYQRKAKNPTAGSRASLDSSIKPLDSDDDSMLEYGDIDPGKFNEDGSFIGQYANKV